MKKDRLKALNEVPKLLTISIFVKFSGGGIELLDEEGRALLDHVLYVVHSFLNHVDDGLGSLSLHLLKLFSVSFNGSDLLARHLSAVGFELSNTFVHRFDSVKHSVDGSSALLGPTSLKFVIHVSYPGSVMSFNSGLNYLLGCFL
jgi:hypothetical protein